MTQLRPEAVGAQSIIKNLTASALKSGVASVQEAALSHAKTVVLAAGVKFLITAVLSVGIGAAGIYGFVQWRSNSSSKAATVSMSADAHPKADSSRHATPSTAQPGAPVAANAAPNASKAGGSFETSGQPAAVRPPNAAEVPAPAAVRTFALDARLSGLMHAADSADWNRVREQSQEIKKNTTVIHGDRRQARAANTEGLKALNSGDYADAISKLQAGVRADPGDVEVRNNLGYAQLKAGNHGDAIATLAQLLLMVPDRTSAWANLSETQGGIGDLIAARSSLRLAVYFSSNRERTVTFLNQAAESHTNEQYRGVVAEILQNISSIPIDVAPKPEKKASVAPVAALPVPVKTGTSTQPAPSVAIAGLLDALKEGYLCLQSKRYDCAIASANVVLRLDPSNTQAQELRQKAKEEQDKAIGGIKVQ